MVQEVYMLKSGSLLGAQHIIKQKDIDSLAAWRFNSIRLPMRYNLFTLPIEQETVAGQNTWLQEGFKTANELLICCADQKYLFLLTAPRGQCKDANISNYDSSKSSLWESAENQDKTVVLWKKLALGYKNEPCFGAYYTINEPSWYFTGTNLNGCYKATNASLTDLQIRITNAVKELDANRLIFIEENFRENNYKGIFPLWDDTKALSFHKYLNRNDMPSIQKFLDHGTLYMMPIWLSESGENSNVWFSEAINLIEKNNINWVFWPMKKIKNLTRVTLVSTLPEYQQLLNSWKNGGTKPTKAFAKLALKQMAENFKMENVTIKYDQTDAMFKQVQTTYTKKKHSLSGKISATNFDGTSFTKRNKGGLRRNDGVKIQPCNDSTTNGFQGGFIEYDEWQQYTINLAS